MKDNLKVIFSVIASILLLCLLVCSVLWIYIKFFAPETKTELSVNLSTVEDTNGKKSILQVKYYENKDKSGVELLDVKFNYYSDLNATNVVASGIQIIGNFDDLKYSNVLEQSTKQGFLNFSTETKISYSFIGGKYGKENHDAGKLCFYEESDNLNFRDVNNDFNDFGYIRVEIEDKIYMLQFGKVMNEYKILWENRQFSSSLSQFIKDVSLQVKSLPSGHSQKNFPYKNLFTIYELQKDGKYRDVSEQDNVFTYFYMDFEHYTSGAKTANDSLFNQIKYDVNFTINGATKLDEHFSDEHILKINENWCRFEFNEEENKHYFDLTDKAYNQLKGKGLKLKLILDYDYLIENSIVLGGVKENSKLKKLGVTEYYIYSKENSTEIKNGII